MLSNHHQCPTSDSTGSLVVAGSSVGVYDTFFMVVTAPVLDIGTFMPENAMRSSKGKLCPC